jgi:hypothetical protein
MRVTYCFNNGPGRTRTYDQGIMRRLVYCPMPFIPVQPHSITPLLFMEL